MALDYFKGNFMINRTDIELAQFIRRLTIDIIENCFIIPDENQNICHFIPCSFCQMIKDNLKARFNCTNSLCKESLNFQCLSYKIFQQIIRINWLEYIVFVRKTHAENGVFIPFHKIHFRDRVYHEESDSYTLLSVNLLLIL